MNEVEELQNGEIETPVVESAEPDLSGLLPDEPEKEISVLEILSEPTERKPEFFEPHEEVNENLPDFEPPEQQPSAPATEEKPLAKKKASNVFSSGIKLGAPVIVEVVDSIVPALFGTIAKTKDREQFCATPEAKKDLSEALAAFLETKDVELSPGWVLIFAFVAAYAPSGILAFELRQAHAKIAKQQKAMDKQQQEFDKQRIDAEKREQETLRELNEIKLKNAELTKQAAAAELDAKRMSAKEVKPVKPKTQSKKRSSGKI